MGTSDFYTMPPHLAQFQGLHESALLLLHGEHDRELEARVSLRRYVGRPVVASGSVVRLAFLGGRWPARGIVVRRHLSYLSDGAETTKKGTGKGEGSETRKGGRKEVGCHGIIM